MRVVDKALRRLCKSSLPRASMVGVHGNRFLLHRVLQDQQVKRFHRTGNNLNVSLQRVSDVTDDQFTKLANYLEDGYPNAYLASFFKNLHRCKAADDNMTPKGEEAGQQSDGSNDAKIKKTLFD